MEDQQLSEESRQEVEAPETSGGSSISEKLRAIGWGAFFVWIGLVMLLKFGSGIAALGIGVITLGIQLARRYFDLKLEGFWVVVGALFLLSGLWQLFEAGLPLVPLLLIVAGLAVVLSAMRGKLLMKK